MQEKILLAGEIRKALYYLMPDLGTARENRIKGVPADGEWHDRIVFDQTGQKFSEYFVKEGHLDEISGGKGFVIADHISGLRLRRQKQMPGILEMQIEAQSNVSLTFNLRIRIRQ